ncbi:hypothetical protein L596_009046 [Steinernema carpocapsae]|uniref:Uncharacterized protein n=1 Tax=Steinernema carpocapsae TaxID=34508 RepID=A0A4U5PE89_STECR|nr:hypothetical protein L596_009046 [Steinernema carpocapsae]
MIAISMFLGTYLSTSKLIHTQDSTKLERTLGGSTKVPEAPPAGMGTGVVIGLLGIPGGPGRPRAYAIIS